MWRTVYVIVLDDGGATVAARYIDDGRVPRWLDTMPGARCDVYDDAPEKGGSLLRSYRWDGRGWVADRR